MASLGGRKSNPPRRDPRASNLSYDARVIQVVARRSGCWSKRDSIAVWWCNGGGLSTEPRRVSDAIPAYPCAIMISVSKEWEAEVEGALQGLIKDGTVEVVLDENGEQVLRLTELGEASVK